ncbi:MAG: hypothetical protein R3314_01285 [Longimicrobiales bacterium]|nr:hypothetical protein [Longimicrobiales bacterium]
MRAHVAGPATLAALATLAVVIPATAQAPRDSVPQDTVVVGPRSGLGYTPPRLSIAGFVGLPGSGPAQSHPVRASRRDLTGVVIDSTLLTRSVEIRGGWHGGVAATLGLGRDWAVRLGAGYSTATLATEYSGESEIFVADANELAGSEVALRVASLESALLYRIPSSRRVQPYLELGGAVSRWSTDGGLPGTASLRSAVTRFEALAGIGGIIPLTGRLSARVHASTRVFQTPVQVAPAGDTLVTGATLVLVSRPAATTEFADPSREAVDLLRLQVGISYDLGRVSEPVAPPREGAAGTTSPPDR